MSQILLVVAVLIILFAVAININTIIALQLWLLPIAIVVFVILYLIYGINRLIDLNRRVRNSWSQIDVQLKKRNDLVPNLVSTVKGYVKHEREIFKEITEARKVMVGAKTPAAMAKASDMLSGALRSLFALAENVPELKASENFKVLQEQLEGLEGNIAYSRQFYNDTVYRYNTAVSTFPGAVFAGILKYRKDEFPFFQASAEEKKTPKVEF